MNAKCLSCYRYQGLLLTQELQHAIYLASCRHPVALALAAVSTARQSREDGSSLPRALQAFQQTLQPSSEKSDAAEGITGEHDGPYTNVGRSTLSQCMIMLIWPKISL